MANKLPEDAFAYYVALGDGRSYALVAEHYAVSRAAVSKRAQSEDWKQRLTEIEASLNRSMDAEAASGILAAQESQVKMQAYMLEAVMEILTPTRFKALIASVLKAAIQKDNMVAARLLIDRAMGKPKAEGIRPGSLDLPDGLETTSDVRRVSNMLLQAVASGRVTPDDAQKAATVVEAARKAIETEDLEARLVELEDRLKKENR